MKKLKLILLLFISSLSLKSYSQYIDTTIQQDVNKRLIEGLISKKLLCICEQQNDLYVESLKTFKAENDSQKTTITQLGVAGKNAEAENQSLKQNLVTETRNKRIWQIVSGALIGVIIIIK
jgi:hypothetical protein